MATGFCVSIRMPTKRVWATLDPFLEPGAIMGRTQANAAFLDGLLALDPYEEYRFYLNSQAAYEHLTVALAQRHPRLTERGKFRITTRQRILADLAETPHHVFHLSDCINFPAYVSALRNAAGKTIFPITSVTHSLSYPHFGEDFFRHLSPCTTERDVVVATSGAGRTVVRAFYDTLREAYGLDPVAFPQPRVEHIPLGVDLQAYAPPPLEERGDIRARLGFGDDVVFLVLARLCHCSKMDFAPVLRAFRRVMAKTPGAAIRLVLAGWNDNEEWGRQSLEAMAGAIDLRLEIHERPSEEQKRMLYAASDVFLSPSDNLQETFGLTLLEAQAMGLPVIASDFDGYRDLVVHERTGLLIPTIGIGCTDSIDLVAPLLFDNHAHLLLAQRTAVDIPSLAEAIDRLARDPRLRAAMSDAAKAWAARFGWNEIAARYVALWDDLWNTPEPVPARGPHPLGIRYARVFAGYNSHPLEATMTVVASRQGNSVYRNQDFAVVYAGLEHTLQLRALKPMLVLARKAVSVAKLCERLLAAFPDMDSEQAQALLLWALKNDMLERTAG